MYYRSIAPLLLLALLTGCGWRTPYATTIGDLPPDSLMTIRLAQGALDAFKPAEGEPASRFTLSATALNAEPPPAPTVRRIGNGVLVDAPSPLQTLLVRVPRQVNLEVQSKRGDIYVVDISGNADIHAGQGNVTVMINGYAQAATEAGHVSVTLGSTQWPGVLRFSDGDGDIELWLTETAKFHVHLHTDQGTLFSDFGLHGTSSGTGETIDSTVNGGGPRGVEIDVKRGNIRLMRLHPEV